jgi:hypothetical protein
MFRIITALFVLSLLPCKVPAQVCPKEGSRLNYRLIGFSFPSIVGATNGCIEVAVGNYNNLDSFSRHITRTFFTGNKSKVIGEVSAFGKTYTWRFVFTLNGTKNRSSGLHHFSTASIPSVDTQVARLRIIKDATAFKDAYVLLDGSRVLYDMRGKPVWYLALKNDSLDESCLVRDLKITADGTVTFLSDEKKGTKAREINYEGEVLWHGPDNGSVSGDSAEHYHHEFTKLPNGHYMVMGNQYIPAKIPQRDDQRLTVYYDGKRNMNDTDNFSVPFGTLIEYDKDGKVVWQWRSAEYFKSSDIQFRNIRNAMFDPHDNAFFFDEKDNKIYISFRNLNRVIKINYPGGTVVNEYGDRYFSDHTEKIGLFYGQHSCRVTEGGDIYLFNNKVCDTTLPTIVVMKQPLPGKNNLEKKWEYQCTAAGVNSNQGTHNKVSSFGNVLKLPDGSFFVSMGSECSKVFIVNHRKETLWSAILEKRNNQENKWDMILQYRASIVTRKELERLIWRSSDNPLQFQ